MLEKFPPTRLVPSFLVHSASRDGNQNSRAFRYLGNCVEKIQDGGRILVKFAQTRSSTLIQLHR